MINIFYDPNYSKTKKTLFTKKLKYSSVVQWINLTFLKLRIPINENLIFSGPQKRINNLIKTFKTSDFVFNKIRHEFSYIVQFDKFGENILKKIISLDNFKNHTVFVGPLFNIEYQSKLVEYVKKYENIKILVASEASKNNLINELPFMLKFKDVIVCPSGVISKRNLVSEVGDLRNEKCLIYYKNRPKEQLDEVLKFLELKNIEFEIFEYGKYKNRKLKRAGKKFKFGIYLSRIESQGFAVQEIMSMNLPLIVWDDIDIASKAISKYYNQPQITGTSITYWSDDCGIKVHDFSELKNEFDLFINNLENYKPQNLIMEKLTYEHIRQYLVDEFIKIKK